MPKNHKLDPKEFRVKPGSDVRLSEVSTKPGDHFASSEQAKDARKSDVEDMADAQRMLWASQSHAMLIILQGMDTSGKDGTIRRVMSGVNPQGVEVHSFKAPNDEERAHHFLWRPTRYLPAKGRIAIFNRSYYEEVLIVRVHPHFLDAQHLPDPTPSDAFWKRRYDDINAFEHTLNRNGTCVLKFYLHLSKQEQRERLLARLDNAEKQWKFNPSDVKERRRWSDYMHVYEQMLSATSTEWAPWHVIPADEKWFASACIADIIAQRIQDLPLKTPEVSPEDAVAFERCREELEADTTAQ